MKNHSNKNKKRRSRPNRSKRKPQRGSIDTSLYVNRVGELEEEKKYISKHSFADFSLKPKLREQIARKGYTETTEIQDKAIKPILKGRDLIGIAGTGTGKTAAFLIPIIQQLLVNKKPDYALIITPTRELANQINDELRSLVRGMNIFSTCLIGGSSVSESRRNLKRLNHIIIGTPGRLQDMARQRALDYSKFNVLVLDEFDRMLDMGFSKEVQFINDRMRNKKQTLFFSATIDKTQERLIDEFTNSPIEVRSKKSTHNTKAIDQKVIRTKGGDKIGVIKELLGTDRAKTILFCETKRHADKVVKKLRQERFRAETIHGDRTQRQREKTLNRFKSGEVHVLVATDVVARGIDVPDVDLVINYQAPRNYTDYVHRIGRTGRAGKMGKAVTLID